MLHSIHNDGLQWVTSLDSDAFSAVDHQIHDSLLRLYHIHWEELHCKQDPNPEWFDDWISRTPAVCGCGERIAAIIDRLPPRFGDWFAYSVDLHNAINAKLSKPLVALAQAKLLYPQCAFDQQPTIANLVAVTSLAPHRPDRQSVCLDSWKKLGLSIVSVNSQAEIDKIRGDYPQVDTWITASDPDCKTQRINTLLDVADLLQTPILLINADIEIHGDQSRLLDFVSQRKNAVGIRHNYETHPGKASIEKWGLDAFLVYPEQVGQLSRVKFSIGKPMWDYWLPWELEKFGECEWITAPYFFHRSHELAWTPEECTAAHESFSAQFGPIDWNTWRSSHPG
jgi:hypothetical protein